MATIALSVGLKGMEGYLVQVEVQLLPGLESVSIIGLPNAAVKESKDRVMAALFANDCQIPDKKIIVHLSPAEQKKNSPIFDLAMAIGIMKEAGDIKFPLPEDAAYLGVLSLDGSIKSVDGMLPAILAAKKEKIKILYLPKMTDFPLTEVEGMELRFVETLQEVVESFSGQLSLTTIFTPPHSPETSDDEILYDKDFKDILGHTHAKRALEIAAAGAYTVLMIGPPGCGKSLLAETFPSILPPLKQESQYDVMSIYQLAGISYSNYKIPPFRNPHHSASAVSLVGGGTNPKPGEVTLAHRGILFLDEMAKFPKRTLDMLRQPMESGKVTISRAASTVTYPADFLLIAAMNPCPCGYFGSRHYYCTCSPKQVTAYTNRVSGPVEDRMDIILKLGNVSLDRESREANEYSAEIRKRVHRAREIQYKRYGGEVHNAVVSNEQLLRCSVLSDTQQQMLRQWASEQHWSTRVQVKIVRLARTISDLNGEERISNEALWEAVNIRRNDHRKAGKGMVK
ncbi:YifB family Mg chelatase-like AAA ATPase [Virgibacillus halodenitrificans]|uniref:YifB family Mg chelatase-like AAA ATPase n=1 Tax=Virgibacillus halodenitrificans TaxID=1482 RepID=UPI001F270C0D|nr:YifB family Mg chelatase-like AAA ATPase [Virgibacillus halodenitrificans]